MDEHVAGCRTIWHDDGATFHLARPEKLNAITADMLRGLSHCLDGLEGGGGRRLVIIGEGDRAFCAGADLAEAMAAPAAETNARGGMARTLFFRLSRSPVISVAAINGLAFGGGLELAMACTFRMAAAHALLSLPEVKLAVIPSYGGTQFLPALVGPARALDLMLTGRPVETAEALAIGLINRIAKDDAPLIAQAWDLAGQVTQHSQVAVNGIRHCVAAAGAAVSAEGLAMEAAQVDIIKRSDDAAEGMRAFLQRRPPTFRHR